MVHIQQQQYYTAHTTNGPTYSCESSVSPATKKRVSDGKERRFTGVNKRNLLLVCRELSEGHDWYRYGSCWDSWVLPSSSCDMKLYDTHDTVDLDAFPEPGPGFPKRYSSPSLSLIIGTTYSHVGFQ